MAFRMATRLAALALPAAFVIGGAGGASAAPAGLPDAGRGVTPPPLTELAHGYHTSCARGPRGHWHYHTKRGRFACDPRPSGNHWIWRFGDGRWGWWHRHEHHWWR